MSLKILFITLSNFGDVILTLPVLDVLRANYSDALITVMVGPRASEVFKNSPYIHELIIYNKYAPLREKMQLFFRLKKERFNIVIDLRNTLFGALLPSKFRTSPFLFVPSNIRHMKERNLYRLMKALNYKELPMEIKEKSLYIGPEDKDYINALLQENGIIADKIVIVSPAAGGQTRRWEKTKFIQLCQRLAKDYQVVLIGRENDKILTRDIKANCKAEIFDFAGLTNLAQLASLLVRASLVVVCDTGTLQLASYLDVPIVALFGPSDEYKYGPWSSKFKVITAAVGCRPCRKPDCEFTPLETMEQQEKDKMSLTGFNIPPCMRKISVDEVVDSIPHLLQSRVG